MHKKISSIKVVDGLAEITRYHDREILERSLITTLAEFLGDVELCLYRVEFIESDDGKESELDLIMRIHFFGGSIVNHEDTRYDADPATTEAILEAIDSGSVATMSDNQQGSQTFFFPVFDKEGEVISILSQVSKQVRFEDQQLAYGFLKVYSNYLNLLEDSQTDKLTGLLNRETLDQEIMAVIAKSSLRKNDPENSRAAARRKFDDLKCWMVLVDLDFFKRINDNYGHLIGDEILILFGRLMKDVFRTEDKLFRFGGEEFVVILETRNEDDTRKVLERFLSTLKNFQFPQVGSITATAGAVEIFNQLTVSEALGSADKALYYGKSNGRNQLVIYQDLVDRGIIEEKKVDDDISFF